LSPPWCATKRTPLLLFFPSKILSASPPIRDVNFPSFPCFLYFLKLRRLISNRQIAPRAPTNHHHRFIFLLSCGDFPKEAKSPPPLPRSPIPHRHGIAFSFFHDRQGFLIYVATNVESTFTFGPLATPPHFFRDR